MKILGIETSCDETAASVIENNNNIKVLSNIISSQIEIHKKSLELYSHGKTKEAFSRELLKNYKFVENIDTLSIDKEKINNYTFGRF